MTDPNSALMSDPLTALALGVATGAHRDQQRKYTGEPYVNHCVAVAELVQRHGGPAWLQAAALLHDTVEDTDMTLDRLAELFPAEVVYGVDYMTEREYSGNRAVRKAAECRRLAGGLSDLQSLKLADLIDNTSSIVEHDPNFAVVYLREMRALLDALTGAWPSIRVEAERSLRSGEEALLQAELGKRDSRE